MEKLVILRHGESTWNRQNLFTGWTDVDLSENGVEEAVKAGRLMKKNGFCFDIAYTSMLKRAIKTLWYVLDEMDLDWIPVYRSWRLNERHYGELQGKNKSETASIYGIEQVDIWRRSYDVRPPEVGIYDARYPGSDPKYAGEPAGTMPAAESLKNTEKRLLPYWKDVIVPQIMMGKRVIVSAHGNSLRSLVKILENISERDIPSVEIPTGAPLVYELDKDIRPLKKYYIEG